MSTASSPPDVPSSTLSAPQPTHPVAEQIVAREARDFHWTAVPDADTYRLQLASSDAFETLYYDETVDEGVSVDLAEVLPDGADTVVWRVRADTDDETSWSTVASFAVGEQDAAPDEQLQVEAPPVPIRPIAGDTVDAEGVTLTWEGVPEASGYRVQVASSDSFEDPIVDLTVDQTTTLTLFDELPGEQDRLYWRVQVLFANAAAGSWSDIVQFATHPEQGDDFEPEGGTEEPTSIERSPVAAGPAREAHTSSAMAMGFIVILIVSFLATLVAIQLVL